MTYRGIVSNGVVVMEGEKPSDGTVVEITPVHDSATYAGSLTNDPAIGMWKDREDLPHDSVEASRALRQRLMRGRTSCGIVDGSVAMDSFKSSRTVAR